MHPWGARVDLHLDCAAGDLEWLQMMVTLEEVLLEPVDAAEAGGDQLRLRAGWIGNEEVQIPKWAQRAIGIVSGHRDAFEHEDVLVDDVGDRPQNIIGDVYLPGG